MSVCYDRVDGWEVRDCAGGFGVFDDHIMVAGPLPSRNEAIRAALELPKPLPAKIERHCALNDQELLKVGDIRARGFQPDRAPTEIAIENGRPFHAEADRSVGTTAR